jgi:4a-hydroxytetrahydrobiopterin dehydratase
MNETLAEKTCTPCRGGIPPLTRDEAERLHAQAPDWKLAEDARRIERTFRFRNFREALEFVDDVGELAETEGHHPDISFGWGYATVSLSTKKIKGLHENDFIMASKIDRIGRQA